MGESKLLTDVCKLTSSLRHVAEESLLEEGPISCAKHGVSLLQVRSATLMRYTNNLARYALCRVRGKPDPALINTLVKDYVVLGKLRPMTKSLSHHFDHLLRETSKSTLSAPSHEKGHRPNPNAFVQGGVEHAPSGDGPDDDDRHDSRATPQDDQYRPPRLAQVMDTDPTAAPNHPRRGSARKHAMSSHKADIAHAIAEVKGYPQEIRESAVQSNHNATASEREHNLRRKYEESNLTRLPLTKQERKQQRNAGSASKQASQFSELLDSVEKISKPRSDSHRTRGNGRPSRSRK